MNTSKPSLATGTKTREARMSLPLAICLQIPCKFCITARAGIRRDAMGQTGATDVSLPQKEKDNECS